MVCGTGATGIERDEFESIAQNAGFDIVSFMGDCQGSDQTGQYTTCSNFESHVCRPLMYAE